MRALIVRMVERLGRLASVCRRRPGRCAFALVLLLLTGLSLGAAGRQLWAEYHFRAAEQCLERREFTQAQDHLDRCLGVWPRHPAVHLLKARAARRAGLFPEAERELETCKRLKASRDAVALELALLQAQQGNLTPDLEAFLNGCVDQGHADSVLILEALSRGYAHNYRLHRALACLDRWLERRPDDVQALLGRGWVYERLSQYEKARDDYRRAAALDPGREEPALRLAEILLVSGKEPAEAAESLDLFEHLQQRYPEDVAVALGVARCRMKMGQTEEAQRLLDELAARHPGTAAVLHERGNLALQLGRPDEAEAYLRRAVTLEPFDYQVHYDMYQCLVRVGKADEARELQARMQRLEADQQRISDLTEQLQARPYDPSLRSEIGRIFLRNGEPSEGVLWLERALEIDPRHQASHQALADYYEGTGDTGRAAEHRRLAGKGESPGPGN
jgi:tetratricopeptide (TPR) repeat protein